jgi:hypothetical protein
MLPYTPKTASSKELSPQTSQPPKQMFTYALGLHDWKQLRPNPIEEPQEIFNIAHDYFSECAHQLSIPTFTGLAMRLNMTKKQLLELKSNSLSPQGHALQLAVSFVVDMVERELITTKAGQPGLIFWLKNIDDWVDKTEVVSTRKTMNDLLDELQHANTQATDISNPNNPLPIDAQVLSEK